MRPKGERSESTLPRVTSFDVQRHTEVFSQDRRLADRVLRIPGWHTEATHRKVCTKRVRVSDNHSEISSEG